MSHYFYERQIMNNMFNNEMFTSPEKCIEECEKQISFANNLITYLEQYKMQMEAMKTMANSAKALQDVNPLNMMNKFMDFMSQSASMITPKADNKKPSKKKSEEPTEEDNA